MKTCKTIFMISALFAFSVLFGAMGCEDKQPGGDNGGGDNPGGDKKPVPADFSPKPLPDDEVWIKVDGHSIYRSEIENGMRLIRPTYEARVSARQMPELAPTIKRHAMQISTHKAVLDNEARKAGVVVTEDEVEESFQEFKSNYPDVVSFEQELAANGLSEEDVRREIWKELLYNRLFEEKVVVPEPTDEEIQQVYDAYKQSLRTPPRADVVQVMIRVAPGATEEEKRKKLELADSILKRAQGGESLGELAVEFSDAPSRSQGGKDSIQKGDLGAEFDKAVFSMKAGDLSPVIESPYGFHVVKLNELLPESSPPLAVVRNQIVDVIKHQKKPLIQQQYIQGLLEKAKIEYVEPLPEDLLSGGPKPVDGGTGGEPEAPGGSETKPGDTAGGEPGGSETKAGDTAE